MCDTFVHRKSDRLGLGGDQLDDSAPSSGAVYLY